jgi:ComF family protein
MGGIVRWQCCDASSRDATATSRPWKYEEAVFSSSEDRIRATPASIAVAGIPIVPDPENVPETAPELVSRKTRLPRLGFASRAAESLFCVLFPSDCRICGEPLLNISRLPVCLDCLARIHPVLGRVCSVCGERVLSSYALTDPDGLRRCPACRRIERPFGRAVAYGSYDGGLRELVHLLKYNGVRPAANVLGRMLAEVIGSLEPAFGQDTIVVIPVPLFKTRRRQRGFNQAELIARAAVKTYPVRDRLHLAVDILQRKRDTHSQIGLTSHQRRENLRGAFAVTRAAEVTGREILLVDDVYTTGTTVTECARVLRRAGASQVWVATVARTLKLASKYAEISSEVAADELPEQPEAPMAKAVGNQEFETRNSESTFGVRTEGKQSGTRNFETRKLEA